MDRVVAAFVAADRVGAAGIVRRRASACCCGPCGSSCRSDGSAGNRARRSPCARIVGQARDHVVERAVPRRIAGLRARKQLVPAGELGLRPLDLERQRRMLHAERALAPTRRRPCAVAGAVSACTLASTSSPCSVADRLAERGRVAGHGLGVDGFEILARLDQLERDVDAGLVLDLDLVAERGVVVAPRLDGEQVPADALSGVKRRLPAVVAERRQRRAVQSFSSAAFQSSSAARMSWPSVKTSASTVTGCPTMRLTGKAPPSTRWRDALDRDARRLHRLRPARDRCVARARTTGFVRVTETIAHLAGRERRIRAAHLQAAADRRTQRPPTEATDRARAALRHLAVVDENEPAALCGARVRGVQLQERRNRAAWPGEAAHLAARRRTASRSVNSFAAAISSLRSKVALARSCAKSSGAARRASILAREPNSKPIGTSRP